MRRDELDPLPYAEGYPSLRSATGRVDIHSLVAKFLADSRSQGAYLEFGVGKGRSAVSALRAYTRAGVCSRFVLCDSFEGLPRLEGPDAGSAQFKQGDYAFSLEQVAALFAEREVDGLAPITCVQGWFGPSTRAGVEEALQGIAPVVLHVDVDLYESTRIVLASVGDLLKPGAVVLFDDWNCFNASNRYGERRATREWLEDNPGFALNPFAAYGWHGQAFVFDHD